MAIIKLVGNIVGGVTVNNEKNFKKFKVVCVIPGRSEKSAFMVIVKGEKSQLGLVEGQTVELEGNVKKDVVGGVDVLLIDTTSISVLTNNVTHYATVYNLVANLTENAKKFSYPDSGRTIYSTKCAETIAKDVSIFYALKFFDNAGLARFSKGLLSKDNVRRVLVAGSIITSYNKKGDVFYLNISIAPYDYKVLDYKKNDAQNVNEDSSGDIGCDYGIDDEEIPF